MNREMDMAEVSDGKLYGLDDMVKADCGGCKGCSMCCEDMVDTIILDPLDIYRLTNALHTTFEAMLGTQLELEVYDGLILPHLKKSIKTGGCPFLDENRRCSVHADRPGFCRIFPLGRYYQDGDFTYILQVHECPKPKTKIRVRKWVDISDADKNRVFINQWHDLQKEMQTSLSRCEEVLQKNLTLQFLKIFYLTPYTEEDFYAQFELRYRTMRSILQ